MPNPCLSAQYAFLEANNVVRNLTSFRMFFTNGPGYGDLAFGVNLLKRVIQLNHFVGTIEMITHNIDLTRYSPKVTQQSREKLGILFNIDKNLLSQSVFEIMDSSGIKIKFIDYEAFKANTTPCDLAIFAGMKHFFVNQFQMRESFFSVANARRIIHTDLFTRVPNFSDNLRINDAPLYIGIEQNGVDLWEARNMPNILPPLKPGAIVAEIDRLRSINPIAYQAYMFTQQAVLRNDTIVQTLYGLHSRDYPAEIIFQIAVIDAIIAKKINNKLIFLLLDKISSETETALLSLFKAISAAHFKTIPAFSVPPLFIRFDTNITLLDLGSSPAVFINFPDSSELLYMALLSLSNLPSLYEGAGSDRVLKLLEKVGMPCPKSFSDLHSMLLPVALLDLGEKICKLRFLDRLTSPDRASLDNYQEMAEALQPYLRNTGRPYHPLSSDLDRMDYALCKLEEYEWCASGKNIDDARCFYANTSTIGLYGLFYAGNIFLRKFTETGIKLFFEKKLKFSTESASLLSCAFSSLARFYGKEFGYTLFAITMFPELLHVMKIPFTPAWKLCAEAFIFYIQLNNTGLPYNETAFLIATMMLLSAISYAAGEKIASKLFSSPVSSNPFSVFSSCRNKNNRLISPDVEAAGVSHLTLAPLL